MLYLLSMLLNLFYLWCLMIMFACLIISNKLLKYKNKTKQVTRALQPISIPHRQILAHQKQTPTNTLVTSCDKCMSRLFKTAISLHDWHFVVRVAKCLSLAPNMCTAICKKRQHLVHSSTKISHPD